MKLEQKNVLDWAFEHKDGYTLENAVFTTFTLTSSVLLDLLLYVISPNLKNESNAVKRLELAEKGFNAAEKLTVFSDKYIFSDVHIPRNLGDVLEGYYIPKTVRKVKVERDNAFFHPKLIITHFSDAQGKPFIRFAVLSKNLTHSKHVIEICTLFETAEYNGENTVPGCQVAEYIKCFTKKSEIKDKEKRIKAVLDALNGMHLCLVLPHGQPQPKSFELMFGKPGDTTMLTRFNDDWRDCKQDSFYFCSDSIDKSFAARHNCKYMISNLRSWAGLYDNAPDYAYCYREYIDYCKVHAKFAEFFKNGEHIIWSGSANFTDNAFSNNYECDVRMVYDDDRSIAFSQKKDTNYDTLEPLPFSRESKKSVIVKVKDDDLKKVKEIADLETEIKKLGWRCIVKENGIIIKTKESLEEDTKTQFKQAEIYLNKRIVLSFTNDNKLTAEIEPFNSFTIPHNGYAIVLIFFGYSDMIEIPVNISVEFENDVADEIKNFKQLDNETVQRKILAGCIPHLRCFIPSTDSVSGFYDSSDTFETRLAKFRSNKNNSDKMIIERIDVYKKRTTSECDDEELEDEIDLTEFIKQREKLIERLDKLKEFLEVTE